MEENSRGKLSELNRLDATELAARISQRKVSPVEVIDAALTRLEATQPALNAFVAITSMVGVPWDGQGHWPRSAAMRRCRLRFGCVHQGPDPCGRSTSALWLVDHERQHCSGRRAVGRAVAASRGHHNWENCYSRIC